MKLYDFDPRNLSRRLRAAIGKAIACAAQTESVMDMAIGGCLGIDAEYTGAVTAHLSMPNRCSILRSVAEIRIDDLDDLDLLDTLIDNINEAFGKRNAIAHHAWAADSTGKTFLFKETARERYEMNIVPLTVDDIEGYAVAIYQSGMELMKFLITLNLMPPLAPAGRDRAHKSKAARKQRRKALGNGKP